jgi:hypothetical protein
VQRKGLDLKSLLSLVESGNYEGTKDEDRDGIVAKRNKKENAASEKAKKKKKKKKRVSTTTSLFTIRTVNSSYQFPSS